jgi:hypothetical protein
MALLNYTTEIDADKSAAEIAKCLSLHGAQAVMTEYHPDTGVVTALSFKIQVGQQPMGFRLPCDPTPVLKILEQQKSRTGNSRIRANREQAVRVAWRIVKDWVEAQMALVETHMVTTSEVFLPYAVMKDGRTLSEHVQSDPSFLLGSGEK